MRGLKRKIEGYYIKDVVRVTLPDKPLTKEQEKILRYILRHTN